MSKDIIQPPLRPTPRYAFGKRLKTASVTALVTSLFWIVFMVLYWPRGGPDVPVMAVPAQSRAIGLPSVQASKSSSQVSGNPRSSRGMEPGYDAPAEYIAPREGLRLPVQGVTASQLTDTYAQMRGDGTRGHNAIDIMAPRGTPVLAVATGTLVKLFQSKNGGNTVYERSPDGKAIYYYAHLDNYAPGLAEGTTVTPGQVLGFVGSSGDADPGVPHLHFAIMALAPGETWSQGRPINPYPLLGGR